LILFLLGFVFPIIFPFIVFVPPYTVSKIMVIISLFILSIFFPYLWCSICPLGTFFILLYKKNKK
jgi:hypothetical protein